MSYVTIELKPDEGFVSTVIDKRFPSLHPEVRRTVLSYAAGNIGAAVNLAERCLEFETQEQVESVIGWPLSEHDGSGEKVYLKLKGEI